MKFFVISFVHDVRLEPFEAEFVFNYKVHSKLVSVSKMHLCDEILLWRNFLELEETFLSSIYLKKPCLFM